MLCRYDTYALKCQDIFSVHGFPVGLIQCENNVLGIPGVGTGGFRHFLEKSIQAKKYNAHPFETRKTGRGKRRVFIPGEHIRAKFVDQMPDGAKSRQAWLVAGSLDDLEVPPCSVDAVITDPPYFDNVQYAELMDFCYIWLRRFLKHEVPFFQPLSTRTQRELTGNKTAGRDLLHFCEGLSRVYCDAARALKPGGLFAFTYHHNDMDAYLPVIVALLDADLAATMSLPCPAEMSASLHIARTGSSVVDTILLARKRGGDGAAEAMTRSALRAALRHQAGLLRRGGVRPTEGDLKCMALGLVSVCAVSELAPTWKTSRDVGARLELAREHVADLLRFSGGLDSMVSIAQEEVPRAEEGQLPLFTEAE
jgi:hypothetical protein